jgi:hypothetical protein
LTIINPAPPWDRPIKRAGIRSDLRAGDRIALRKSIDGDSQETKGESLPIVLAGSAFSFFSIPAVFFAALVATDADLEVAYAFAKPLRKIGDFARAKQDYDYQEDD